MVKKKKFIVLTMQVVSRFGWKCSFSTVAGGGKRGKEEKDVAHCGADKFGGR